MSEASTNFEGGRERAREKEIGNARESVAPVLIGRKLQGSKKTHTCPTCGYFNTFVYYDEYVALWAWMLLQFSPFIWKTFFSWGRGFATPDGFRGLLLRGLSLFLMGFCCFPRHWCRESLWIRPRTNERGSRGLLLRINRLHDPRELSVFSWPLVRRYHQNGGSCVRRYLLATTATSNEDGPNDADVRRRDAKYPARMLLPSS